MKLLVIGIVSVILFFPLYWLLHPILGAEWGGWISAVLMYIGFPVFFLKIWKKEWEGPVVTFLNYVIALFIFSCSVYFIYIAYIGESESVNAIRFFAVYGSASIYYLFVGRFHINLKGNKT